MLGLPVHLPRLPWAPMTDLVLRAGDAELGGESARGTAPSLVSWSVMRDTDSSHTTTLLI